jgi:hypothetical protein
VFAIISALGIVKEPRSFKQAGSPPEEIILLQQYLATLSRYVRRTIEIQLEL